jgi:hypothetical protein
MVLTTEQVNAILKDLVDEIQLNRPVPVTRPDIKAAANAMETLIINNAAAINNALPDPFKTDANNQEKALLLAFVALKIAGK